MHVAGSSLPGCRAPSMLLANGGRSSASKNRTTDPVDPLVHALPRLGAFRRGDRLDGLATRPAGGCWAGRNHQLGNAGRERCCIAAATQIASLKCSGSLRRRARRIGNAAADALAFADQRRLAVDQRRRMPPDSARHGRTSQRWRPPWLIPGGLRAGCYGDVALPLQLIRQHDVVIFTRLGTLRA